MDGKHSTVRISKLVKPKKYSFRSPKFGTEASEKTKFPMGEDLKIGASALQAEGHRFEPCSSHNNHRKGFR
jgi:hypothetical protein